jgi:preprotein translocase subunit SecB
MSTGSVSSVFDFLSYKIDKVEFKMQSKVKYLLNNNFVKPDNANLSIRLRNTEKYNIEGAIRYVGGLAIRIVITDEEDGSTILEGEFAISGVFAPAGDIEKAEEEKFATINLPALLMPYLRSAMTNTLASAGFGTMLFPLINIYDMAKSVGVKLIDHTKPTAPPEE